MTLEQMLSCPSLTCNWTPNLSGWDFQKNACFQGVAEAGRINSAKYPSTGRLGVHWEWRDRDGNVVEGELEGVCVVGCGAHCGAAKEVSTWA